MICDKCRHVNKDNATTCKHCGADFTLDSADKENENGPQISAEKKESEPKSAIGQIGTKIELDSIDKQDNNETAVQNRGRSWLIPAIVGAGIAIVAGIIVLFVLIIAAKDNNAAAAVQTVTLSPSPKATATPTPTPTPTPIPTTTPEPTEDMSSLFERPSGSTVGE